MTSLNIVIEAYLAFVGTLHILLLASWIDHIERVHPFLWLIHELGPYPMNKGNLEIVAFRSLDLFQKLYTNIIF